jgi:hypothetical protein
MSNSFSPACTSLSALYTELKNFLVMKLLNQYVFEALAAVTLSSVIDYSSSA